MSTKTAKPPFAYTVKGRKLGEFPLDMLRRDESRAATPEDQAVIDLLSAYGSEKSLLPDYVEVNLVTDCVQFPPNVERWESFGWRVIASDHPRNYLRPSVTDDVDVLRQQTMKKLADEVVRLRGLVHAANPAYDAVRFAAEVAGQDAPYRERAIGYVTATRLIIGSEKYPGMLDGRDKDALGTALDFARDLLSNNTEERIHSLCGGERLTQVSDRLSTVLRMFAQ